MNKYQLGEKYYLKVFIDVEEMEYLGQLEIYNGVGTLITCAVFKRIHYGRPDIVALHNDKFFIRPTGNTINGFGQAISEGVRFIGLGHETISVNGGECKLTIEEFKEQVRGLVSDKVVEECILSGEFWSSYSSKGQIKWCNNCRKIRQTSCCACGCGSCESCGHSWYCGSGRLPKIMANLTLPLEWFPKL